MGEFMPDLKKKYLSENILSARFFLLFLALCCCTIRGYAQTRGGVVANTDAQKPMTGENYAIIFGVSNYPALPPLKYADKDAELFRDYLETPGGGNTKPENIFFRTNENAKASDFLDHAYSWLNDKKFKEGDRLYIYFSGHGDSMNEFSYFLLPYDCAPAKDEHNYMSTGSIPMSFVLDAFVKPMKSKKVDVVLIVDACRTIALPGGEKGQLTFAGALQSTAAQLQGDIIMLSTGAGQVAIESPKIGNGHGLFTWYLVAGLSGEADQRSNNGDNDGKVSLAEITDFVGTKVRVDANQIFKAIQIPVILSPDDATKTVANVDSSTYHNWQLAESMVHQNSGNTMAKVLNKNGGQKGVTAGSMIDTALAALDNKFIAAIKTQNLLGRNSAEDFYDRMNKKWPGHPITEDAKYSLATEFINFGQEKINLFLSGKGIVHLQRMENAFKNNSGGTANKDEIKNMPAGIEEQIVRMRTVTITGFDKAAEMMEKAVKLLNNEPELLDPLYTKLYFLQAAACDQVSNVSIREQGVGLIKKAIKRDTSAAYNYLMLGHLLYDLKNDSCEFYFKKAIKLAPKWAEPESDLANFYSEKNKFDLAIGHYTAAVRLDSLDDIAFQNIGVLYTDERKLDSARKYFLKGLSINPCNKFANCNLGFLSAKAMVSNSVKDPNFKISEQYLKKSITCDTGFTHGYFIVAGLFNKVNLKDSSVYYLRMGISKNPKDPLLYRSLGNEYLEMKDTVKGEAAYQKALDIDSLDINNYLTLSQFYCDQGASGANKALKYSQKALQLDPNSSAAYRATGDIYYAQGIYGKAILNYQAAIKLTPNDADSYNNLGNAYFYQQDVDRAITSYEKAVQLDTTFAIAYNNVGACYYIKKDFTKAITDYQKAVKLDSTYSNAYKNLGNIYTSLKQYDKGILYYGKAINLDPGNAQLYNALGNVYYFLKQYNTAIIYHKKTVELAPSSPLGYNDLGADYDDLNKPDTAALYYQKSIGVDSTRALPYINLGHIYQNAKAYNKALAYYSTAAKRNPANPVVYNNIANVYLALKDYPKEIYYYNIAIQLDSTITVHLQDLGLAYVYTKDYKNGLACLQKAIKYYPDDPAVYYNVACGFSLANDMDIGMKYLKLALQKGFKDYAWLNTDPDISNLRKLADFNPLMKQYFPDKVK
jgi:tetratricopeptide (TPR) repeat protein